jgi:hypothetical protein
MPLDFLAIVLVPCLLLLAILVFITINRYISYKERVALAQLGFTLEDLNRDAEAKKRGNRGVLWGGVITAMSGLALTLGLATLGTGAWLLGGLIPLFVGLGMVLIYFLTMGQSSESGKGEPAGAAEEEIADIVTRVDPAESPLAEDDTASSAPQGR